MAKVSSSKSSIKTPMLKREKSKPGAPIKITNLLSFIKNTPKSGHPSPLSWEIATKTNAFIATEDSPSLESTEKSGLPMKTKPSVK